MKESEIEQIIHRVLVAGYEKDKQVDDDAQLIHPVIAGKSVDTEWWNPVWGCDSVDRMLSQLRYELQRINNEK